MVSGIYVNEVDWLTIVHARINLVVACGELVGYEDSLFYGPLFFVSN
jgi:hypothetical protein